jgi:hypothetical protein
MNMLVPIERGTSQVFEDFGRIFRALKEVYYDSQENYQQKGHNTEEALEALAPFD